MLVRKCVSSRSSAVLPPRYKKPLYACCPAESDIRIQRRIPRAVLELAEARLQAAAKRIAAASDFAALHGIVEREIGSIRGIGALTVYDIAHRLGAHFGKAPALVYLHAGTRTGAAAFGLKSDSIDPRELPAPFSRLAPAEIEDCLCIYKDELRGARRANRSFASACRT